MAWPCCRVIARIWQPVAPHTGTRHHSQPPRPNKKPWATNTTNLTTSARGLCNNRTRVLTTVPVTYWARACGFCFPLPFSLATLLKEQPKWHPAADEHHCHCQSQPFPHSFLAGRKNRAMPKPLLGSMKFFHQKRCFCEQVQRLVCKSYSENQKKKPSFVHWRKEPLNATVSLSHRRR